MRVNRTKAVIVLVLIAQFMVAWAGHRAWTRIDSWFRPPPSQWSRNASPLGPHQVIAVSVDKRAIAEAMLIDTAAKLLTPAEVSDLAGVDVGPGSDSSFYLVRAVYLNEGTGGFNVRRAGTEVEVQHASLGRRAVPMKRSAIIAQLTDPPTEVYVTCSMAE